MARLPQPGSDNGNWGNILNDYLSQTHKPDGTLKDNSVNSTAIQSGAVTETQLHPAVQTKLNAATTPTTTTIPNALNDYYRPLRGVTSTVSSAIASGESKAATFIPWYSAAGKFRYAGVVPEALSGDVSLCLNNNNTFGQQFVFQPISIEFWTNATDLRMHGYVTGKADFWALVDDMRIMPGWLHANFADNYYTWSLTQTSALWRKVRVSLSGAFTGISTNSGAVIVPTTPAYQLAVVGDSLVQGGISINNAVAPGTAGLITAGGVFGEFEQFTGLDVWRCAAYGTGYVAQSDFAANGPYGSTQRVNKLASLPAMNEVVVFGTVNDGPSSQSAIVSAANAAWTAIKSAQPNAKLTVVGMECFGTTDTSLDAKNAALKSAALSHSKVDRFIDLRSNSFITGTGNEGAPAGNGNQDAFVASDATHPTHAGARYWGENMTRLLGLR